MFSHRLRKGVLIDVAKTWAAGPAHFLAFMAFIAVGAFMAFLA